MRDHPDSRLWIRRLSCVLLMAVALAFQAAGTLPAQEHTTGLGLLEAVEVALERDPEIALERHRLDAARGARVVASGRFDPTLSAALDRADDEIPLSEVAHQERESLDATLGWTQELRGGLQLTPEIRLEQLDDGVGTVNTATVTFTLRQPLLRGRGRDVVTADEQAAVVEAEAARLDLAFLVSQRLRTVVSRYWSARAARADLEILLASEQSARDQLETTHRLVEADLTPAADLVQLEADLISREASRIGSQRDLLQALRDFGRELGLDADEITRLNEPSDPFPGLGGPWPDAVAEAASYVRAALEHRADLRAAELRRDAARERLVAAENGIAPQLDLVVTPSYTGLTDGGSLGDLLAPLGDNIPGLSTSVGLRFELPVRNQRAEGALIQARSAVGQRDAERQRVVAAIGADVPAALNAVVRNAERLERLERAVALFEKALENEQKKLRAGSSTVIDVITQRDRLTSAQQRRVAARGDLARSLVELRFQTGTLLEDDAGVGGAGAEVTSVTLRRESLVSLPLQGS